jgi:autotransporter passenger strand-loop-strand repeat protein
MTYHAADGEGEGVALDPHRHQSQLSISLTPPVCTVSGGTIISSGEQIVEAGAVASGMTVDSGGLDYLVSGGTAVGTTISGGTLEVTSGANGGNVTFASGGILQLDSLVAFGGTISGFHLGDEIDLRGLAYTSGTTNLSWAQLTSGANASGTLTVSSGAAVETLTLLGRYTAANFSATSDGFGGTLITDPPASNSAIQNLHCLRIRTGLGGNATGLGTAPDPDFGY